MQAMHNAIIDQHSQEIEGLKIRVKQLLNQLETLEEKLYVFKGENKQLKSQMEEYKELATVMEE